MAGEKTEKATPKRKKDERKKGNVFLSQEAITAFSLIVSFFGLKSFAPLIYNTVRETISKYIALGATQTEVSVTDVHEYIVDGCIVFVKTAIPLLLICGLVAIVVTMAQTKMMFSTKAFAFKANRINPANGIKKMFSMRALVELLKGLFKVVVLGYIIYSVLKDAILTLPSLMDATFTSVIQRTGEIAMSIGTKAGVAFIFLAAADYLYQWWEYEKNLRMSKQEIKDEYKQIEGDPQIKGRLRSMQQQKSRQRMMQSVPDADVVIRNPTHIAIAIKFDKEKDRAPHVVAKGVDQLALRIVKVAQDNNVYITEDKPLARAMYDAVDVGDEIPEKFYQPIAKVLAFVYSLRKERK